MVFIRYGRLTIDQHDIHSIEEIKSRIQQHFNLHEDDYYYILNGKRIDERNVLDNDNVTIVPRLVGGKGGFGSMLRAIGAQIEKTTNREACRDLSGRRLRDVNEEKRQKELLKTKKEQEKQAVENRRRKLEKCLEGPKLELIDDKEFNEIRSSLPESLQEAINEGLKVEEKLLTESTKTKTVVGKKRLRDEENANIETEATTTTTVISTMEKKTTVVKKKRKLWIDDDIDSSCDSELSENEK